MTTYTTTGYSRVVNYETSTYSDFAQSTLTVIRPDHADSFIYQYQWIDETGQSPKFAQVFDEWSHTAVLERPGATSLDLADSNTFVETTVFVVSWGVGKKTYVMSTFQPAEGIETYFIMGGDLPTITGQTDLDSFLANPKDYVMEGPFEPGNSIPLAGFMNGVVTQDETIDAKPGEALFWDGGIGHDVINGGLTEDTLIGGAGNDTLTGGGGADTLVGGLGDDLLSAGGNFDMLSGGEGNDTLIGAATFGEFLDGGSGNDYIEQTNGQDFGGGFYVSHGHANGGSGEDTIEGGLAGDIAFGGNGNDLMNGNEGDDYYTGGNGNDTINGGLGGDRAGGGADSDSLVGGAGNDTLSGELGNDTLYGDAGDDVLNGNEGVDYIYGGDQHDVIDGGASGDQLFGNSGNDTINGGIGHDQILGGSGHDLLNGGDHNDMLKGETGRDTLSGGNGVDTLIGGAQNDVLDGGAGADKFRYTDITDSINTAMDTIIGFEQGVDDFDFSPLDANPLVTGNQAFVYVGLGPFTAVGQVRISEMGGDTMVEVNTVGTGGAEMTIIVDNVVGLQATDFIL